MLIICHTNELHPSKATLVDESYMLELHMINLHQQGATYKPQNFKNSLMWVFFKVNNNQLVSTFSNLINVVHKFS
jgi:hypothetical protein